MPSTRCARCMRASGPSALRGQTRAACTLRHPGTRSSSSSLWLGTARLAVVVSSSLPRSSVALSSCGPGRQHRRSIRLAAGPRRSSNPRGQGRSLRYAPSSPGAAVRPETQQRRAFASLFEGRLGSPPSALVVKSNLVRSFWPRPPQFKRRVRAVVVKPCRLCCSAAYRRSAKPRTPTRHQRCAASQSPPVAPAHGRPCFRFRRCSEHRQTAARYPAPQRKPPSFPGLLWSPPHLA